MLVSGYRDTPASTLWLKCLSSPAALLCWCIWCAQSPAHLPSWKLLRTEAVHTSIVSPDRNSFVNSYRPKQHSVDCPACLTAQPTGDIAGAERLHSQLREGRREAPRSWQEWVGAPASPLLCSQPGESTLRGSRSSPAPQGSGPCSAA